MTTTASSGKTLKDVAAGLKVMDVDTHWCEPPDLWTSRAPARLKDRVPQMHRFEDGTDHWFIEGNEDFGYGVMGVVGNKGEKYRDGGNLSLPTFDKLHEASFDPKARIKYMDEYGIGAQIVYPNAAGFSAGKFMARMKDPELEVGCIKIYNDAASEFQRESENRCFPQALLPMHSMDDCVKEMRRSIEDLGLKGFTVSDNMGPIDLPDYTDPYWIPFWEAANSMGVPLNFHIGGTVLDARSCLWPCHSAQVGGPLASTFVQMSNAVVMVNFFASGLQDKYPNVKFVSVESGIGWVPYFLESLTWNLAERAGAEELAKMQRTPKEYFQDQWYVTFWYEKIAPQLLLEEIGVNNVMWETDFPHPTCLYPDSKEHANESLAGLSEPVRRRVLQDNAAELYKIPVGTTA